ncbi:hypothetical protein E2320_017883 [Naja naja]|nr:hypothetical protein E2320_017883 [Naja naja]
MKIKTPDRVHRRSVRLQHPGPPLGGSGGRLPALWTEAPCDHRRRNTVPFAASSPLRSPPSGPQDGCEMAQG